MLFEHQFEISKFNNILNGRRSSHMWLMQLNEYTIS